MCSYSHMEAANRRPRLRLAALALAAAATAAVTAPAAASAEPAAKMTITFPAATVRIAGPRALVNVKCVGTAAGSCTGTLSLQGSAGSHKVPYALEPGEKRLLVVPLSSDQELLESPSVRAVAETMQPRGSSVTSSRVLRIMHPRQAG
jgi:hypothetical protein